MEKHSKHYAEQLAKKEFPYSQADDDLLFIKIQEWCIDAYKLGYMKAIEETNVAELLDALKLAQQLIEKHLPNDLTVHDIINNAINKAQ